MSTYDGRVTEIEFSWSHDCPFNRLTADHPELSLNWDVPAVGVDASTVIGVFSVSGLGDTLSAAQLIEELESYPSVLSVDEPTNTVFEVELRRNVLTMSPELLAECFDVRIREHDGVEEWRVVTPSKRVENYLFHTLGEIKGADFDLRRKTSTDVADDVADAARPTDVVTDKQHEAIRIGYERGYFDYPRRSTAEEVANELDITASSYISRLRRGQRRLVEALFEPDPDEQA